MKTYRLLGTTIIAGLFLTSCGDDDESEDTTPSLQVPGSYVSSNYTTNVATESAVRAQLDALDGVGEDGVNDKVNSADLRTEFTEDLGGGVSLSSITTSYYRGFLTDAGGIFDALSDASATPPVLLDSTDFSTSSPLPGEGGVVGTGSGASVRLLDETGMEVDELIEKGLFGALLYNHAINLISDGVTSEDVDRLIETFGASPDFPNNADDTDMAQYAARRDQNDGNGVYTQFRDAAIKLKAAIEAGSEFNAERDEALESLKEAWEKANGATVINYCHQAIDAFNNNPLTNADIANGLHAYAEGVGFLHGWRTINDDYRIISDAQIESVLNHMKAPYNGTATSYMFVADPTQISHLDMAINELASIYGFSAAEVESFKLNHVSLATNR